MDGTVTLDEIMNEDVSTPEDTTSPETTTTETDAQRARDEQGRFAATEAAEPTDHDAQTAIEWQGAKLVPLDALHASRKGEQTAKEEAEMLRRELAELRGQVTALTPKAQPSEPAKPTNWYADPDKAIAERLTPIQQEMADFRNSVSLIMATKDHGAEVIQAAQQALREAVQTRPNAPDLIALNAQASRSVHPVEDMIAWHKRQLAMSEIGDDPNAFRDKERERIRAELMAELGIEQTEPVTGQQPSITKPPLKLPQSLSRIPGAGNGSGALDASDAGIFKEAMGDR